jgi:hypothetical protein
MTITQHSGVISWIVRFPATAPALALLLVAGAATAQDEKPAKPAKPLKMADRMDAAEARLAEIGTTLGEIVGRDTPSNIRSQIDQLRDNFDGLLKDLESLRGNVDESAVADEDRDERLDALNDDVTGLWAEVEAIKTAVADLSKNEVAGYDDGFFVGSRDGKHRLKINAYAKPYYRLGLQKGWDLTPAGDLAYDEQGQPMGGETEVVENAFGLAAGRLILSAQVFETVKVVAEIDYGTLSGQIEFPLNATPPASVAYSHIDVNEHALSFKSVYGEFAPMPELRLRAGQFKPGFDRETLFPTNGMTFSSLSLMTRRHARFNEGVDLEETLTYRWDYEVVRGSSFGYDRGFQVAGCVADGLLKYAVGAYNGGGPNVGTDNRDILTTIRLESDFLGMMTPGMSDLDTVESPLVSVGAAFAYDLPEHRDAIDPARTYNAEEISVTGDLHAKWMGVSLLASVFYRTADHGEAWPTGIDSLGLGGQLAYFNELTGLEPAFRYGSYDPDIDRDLNHIHELTASLGYHVVPRHLSLAVEWRGMFAAQKDQTYLKPWGVWFEDLHEITLMAQASF